MKPNDLTYTDYVIANMFRYLAVSRLSRERWKFDTDVRVLQDVIDAAAENKETDQDMNDYFKNL